MKTANLGDLCRITSAKRIFESEYVVKGIPFVRGLEITDGSIKQKSTKYECYISNERYQELKSKYGVPRKGDILITAVGTIGNLCYVDFEHPFYYKDGNIIQFTDFREDIDSHYLYYYMKSPYFIKQLNNALIGAVQKALTMIMLKDIEIIIPTMSEQIRIVQTLSAIENKVSNNLDITDLLEKQAKLLYDYWFVQFDFPDENGKPYKSSGGKMIWNEELKRDIPVGWEVGTFGDCISSINTGLNPRDHFKLNTGGKIRYLTVKNLTKEGSIDFSSCDLIDEEARRVVHNRSDISIGDILFASISPLGRCFLILDSPSDWDINESVFSIRPDYKKMTSIFLYMIFMSEAFVKRAEGNSTGSVFKGIRIAELQSLKTIIPPKGILDSFDKTVSNLFSARMNFFNENQELASLRDFLLPMLMNGQVKIKEKTNND